LRTSISILLLTLALAVPNLASAGTVAGGDLPAAMSVDDEMLRLNGAGTFEAGRLFRVDVFKAGLYLARPTASAAHILHPEQMRVLALRFKRDVSQSKLVDVARRALSAHGVGASLERFLASLPGAARGDLLTFTHHPGRGLEVAHNRHTVLRLPDEALSQAFFESWVGPGAVDSKLSRSLLGTR
jgi:hypothetical protein